MRGLFEGWHLLVLGVLAMILAVPILAVVFLVIRGAAAAASPSPSQGQAPPPGWYGDQDGVRRWWDGTAWTEHTQP